MNGIRVVAYDLRGPLWRSKVSNSIFANLATFGRTGTGHIVFQCQDASVSFRNIRLRPLAARARTTVKTHVAIVPTAAEVQTLRPVGELQRTLLDENAAWRDRDHAVRGLARTPKGLHALIDLAEKEKFPDDIKEMAGVAVAAYGSDTLREVALKHFPAPQADFLA